MKSKHLLTLAFALAGVLFLVENLPAQKLASGGKPKPVKIEAYKNNRSKIRALSGNMKNTVNVFQPGTSKNR